MKATESHRKQERNPPKAGPKATESRIEIHRNPDRKPAKAGSKTTENYWKSLKSNESHRKLRKAGSKTNISVFQNTGRQTEIETNGNRILKADTANIMTKFNMASSHAFERRLARHHLKFKTAFIEDEQILTRIHIPPARKKNWRRQIQTKNGRHMHVILKESLQCSRLNYS